MAWDTCKIALHSPHGGFFYTNDIVSGFVILDVREDFKVKQIDFKVKGISKASWARSSPTVPFIRKYSEKREVFSVTVDVFGDLKGTTIESGIFTRPFNFFLPPDLPSSYEDSIAKVYYEIKISSKSFFKTVCPLAVINKVDLNQFDEYKIPLLYEMRKKIGKSGHFSLIFKTYKGFTARQSIPFEAIISNERKIKVRKIMVYLIKKIEYNVSSGFNIAEKTLCESVYKNVLNIVSQTCCFNMEIPHDVTPSTIRMNDLMVSISYSLRVKVTFLFYLPLVIDIPVTIASVPIAYNT
ncbi:uncharacterized protein LOC125067820 [Vanessa atalanta]|uniref:uncharacterized protein LOC125067820 n=1 Tax=Vanessa atalanta TaxID=42275 RepID=UPI001FCDE937|nr:uncharacterized protein LOC125067820 [Vanessa atalanta]